MFKDKKKYNQYMRDYQKRIKQKKIKRMGGKCQVCGENQIEFLTLAKRKRKTVVLCWNCRFANKGREK